MPRQRPTRTPLERISPETWTPPGWPVDASITDAEGHPLTWGRVRQAHEWLVAHAFCEQATTTFDSGSEDEYDENGEPRACPCQWHPVTIEYRSSHQLAVDAWPGHICGSCWAASCACGRVFDDESDAADRWLSGRLRCRACLED